MALRQNLGQVPVEFALVENQIATQGPGPLQRGHLLVGAEGYDPALMFGP